MSRIEFPSPETMSQEQRAVYDKVVSGPRGKLSGPLRAALYNPELADRWQAFGALLRYGTTLPPRLSEIAILVTGRYCNAPFEWYMHRIEGEKAGIEAHIIASLLAQQKPAFTAREDALVYAFALELNRTKSVCDTTYAAALACFGARTLVELTALVGYYTLVAMTLNTHEIPLPPGVEPEFAMPQHQSPP